MKTKLILLFLLFYMIYPLTQTIAQRIDAAELTLKKTLNGDTVHTIREFPVDKKLASLIIEITGTMTRGKISITLLAPNGKSNIYDIDVTTNMEFRRTINLKKMPEYIGDWKIFIDAENAFGNYCLNMRTTVI